MQVKLLNEIVREIGGEQAVGVLDLLIDKRDVNEFYIAKKLKLTINQIRNVFYKLTNFGLVTFIRKKDKKKGWYTYFWTIDSYRSLELLDKRIEKEIESLKNQLKSRETKRFYICNTCKTEVGEESVLLHNFACQECGQVYQLNEDQKVLASLKSRIERLERQRAELYTELGKLTEEKSKRIIQTEKREAVKRKTKMRERRLERKKLKNKEDRKLNKGKVKKIKKKIKKKKR